MHLKLLFVAFIFTLNVSANRFESSVEEAMSEISFEKSAHNFGNVVEGIYCQYSFIFKNKGKVPIIIDQVPTSCGCDMTTWSKEPVLLGKTGVINYTINTSDRSGFFS